MACQPYQRRNSGFTLIEFLVVAGVLAVVMGLMVAVVHKARDAAGRAQSQNNMKQILTAVYHANDNVKCLPPAVVFSWTAPPYSASYTLTDGTFFFSLLPYFEQGAIPATIANFPGRSYGAIGPTQAAMSVPLGLLLAPDDGTGPGDGIFRDGFAASWMKPSPVDVALCSYAANWQVFARPGYPFWDWNAGAGSNKVGFIRDGVSNTVFIAEKRKSCGPAAIPNNIDTFGNGWGQASDDHYWPVFARINNKFSGDPKYLVFDPPQVNPPGADCQWWRAHGHSPSGTLVGMGDVSVRLVSSAISTATWNTVVLPNDGAPPGADWDE